MAQITLGIIGLGRLGTSFGLAVKRYLKAPNPDHQITILGTDKSAEVRSLAKKLDAIDSEARTINAVVEAADLVILTMPYHKYDEYYEAFGADVKHGAVLVDFSPLKGRAIKRAHEYLPRESGALLAYSIGATAILNPAFMYDPHNDTRDARADLFDKGTLILSPDVKARPEAIQLVSDFAALIGMSVHFTDPAEHDGLIAAMEAVPLLTNLALFRSANSSLAWDDLRRLTTPVFALSTAALSHYSPDDAAATFTDNAQPTLRYLDRLIDTLKELRGMVAENDIDLMSEAFADALDKHEQWVGDRKQATWDAPAGSEEMAKVSVGEIVKGRFFGRLGGKK